MFALHELGARDLLDVRDAVVVVVYEVVGRRRLFRLGELDGDVV